MLVAASVATWTSSWLITTCAPAPRRPRVTSGLTKTWTGASGLPRPVHGGRHRGDARVGPVGRVEGGVERRRRGRHLDDDRRPPVRQHAADDLHPAGDPSGVRRRPHGVAPGREADTITSAVPVRRTSSGALQPQRLDAVARATEATDGHRVAVRHEGDDHLRAGGLAVEAPEGPRQRDLGRPRAVGGRGAGLVDVPRGEVRDVQGLGVVGDRAQQGARGAVVGRREGACRIRVVRRDGLLEQVQGGRRGTGAGSVLGGSGGRGPAGVLALADEQGHDDRQPREQRKTGHPPDVGDRSSRSGDQPGRTAPTNGIE